MKKNKQELKSVLYELSSPEERSKMANEKIGDLFDKFNELYTGFKDTIENRDQEYSQALEILITETDKQVKSYLSDIQKDYTSKVSQINSLIGDLESKTSYTEMDLKDQIRQAKSDLRTELQDFSSKIKDTYDFYRSETKDLILESRKSVMELDGKTEKLLKDIEKVKSDLIDKFSKATSNRGGSAHFQIAVNGIVATTRYADINIVASGATVANDDSTKKTVITLQTGGTGSGYQVPTSGVLGQDTFVWATTPNVIVVDGVPKQATSTDGTVNWTGTTTTVLTIYPNYDIFAIS